MFLLLSVSGFPIINQYRDIGLASVALFSTILLLLKLKSLSPYTNKSFLIVLVSLLSIFILQSIIFNYFSLNTFIGLFVRILIAYNVFKLLSDRFLNTFIKVLFAICLIGFFIYVIGNIFPNFFSLGIQVVELGRSKQTSFIFYNFIHGSIARFSGPFWEPGAFAGYLIIALYFNLFYNQEKISTRINIVFIISIILTLSTMGYISLIVLLGIYYLRNVTTGKMVLLLPIFLIFASIAIFQFEFIGSKLISQWGSFSDYSSGYVQTYNSQRFISAYVDFLDFVKHPFLGTGISNFTRYEMLSHESTIRTNGIFDLLLKFGGVGFIILMRQYLLHFKSNLYHEDLKNLRYITLFLLLMINFSELFFYLPFFFCFLFNTSKRSITDEPILH